MIQYSKKLFSSKVSIIGLFTTLVIILSIPLLLVFSQQPQDIRQRAAEPSPNLLPPTNNNPGYISGYVFDDKNENGTRDPGEQGIQGVQIKITQITQTNNAQPKTKTNPDITSIVTTDASGFFKYLLTNGPQTAPAFLVKVLLPTGYRTINSNPVVFNNVHNDTQKILEFGLFKLNAATN
jgi:hypothetical protein